MKHRQYDPVIRRKADIKIHTVSQVKLNHSGTFRHLPEHPTGTSRSQIITLCHMNSALSSLKLRVVI